MQTSVDTVEYRPALHAVQLLAPDWASVLVTEPGAQSEHVAKPTAPNLPAVQSRHSEASVTQ